MYYSMPKNLINNMMLLQRLQIKVDRNKQTKSLRLTTNFINNLEECYLLSHFGLIDNPFSNFEEYKNVNL